MDDSCAVCAETLEWVAYGACGHKDVCSTCVARLRFICDDRRCCICKTESGVVLVTKALGVYTETVNDFSLLPSEAKEGKVGRYWYHEDTQALFDDLDHYKMIKAMCRLSCAVCDKTEDQTDDSSRRRARYKNIEQLKGHLFHKHRLFMCSLCLEGRKVFICEQKLYTRSQLTQHINTGDSDVDGSESERGGFTGHPMCEFCRTPFYGDNELYTHMSTEHYTCHICQRQHPGQYDYYKNYDDLEMHFRRDHFLCEDESCLGKKFVVFTSDSELKRHNTLEHGGRMSRSQRNAALQIPTSFRYRRNSEQEARRGRARTFERDLLDNELSFAIQASLETASGEPASAPINTDHADTIGAESSFPPLESVSITDSEQSYRYRQAVSQIAKGGGLGESSFPPLPVAPGTNQPSSHLDVPSTTKNMAAYLRSQNNRKAKASSSTPSWPASNRTHGKMMTNSTAWPSINVVSGSASHSVQSRRVAEVRPALSSHSTCIDTQPPSVSNSSLSVSSSSSRPSGIARGIVHSSSAPNLSEQESHKLPSMEFPPISAAQTRKSPAIGQALTKPEDVHSANKSLVEKMRAALEFDEEKFTAFRDISGEYRNDLIDSETYMAYVEQFGLSHLVLELARLLPDAQKQKDLIDAYNAGVGYNRTRENGIRNGANDGVGKGKGKSAESNHKTSNAMSTVKEQQSRQNALEEEVEVLSKDGYRAFKGKSKIAGDVLARPTSQMGSSGGGANEISSNDDGKGKQRKKTSKFHRVRLGDGSVEALLDLKKGDLNPDMAPNLKEASSNNSVENLASRGVWKSGGGQKLFASAPKRGPNH